VTPTTRGTVSCLLVAIAALMATGVLGGCAADRAALGTNSSPCYRALAVAEDAVHSRGTFAGVRLVGTSSLRHLPHLEQILEERMPTRLTTVCLVAYRGEFRPIQVERPAGPVPPGGVGHFAVVVVSTPQNRLIATVLLEREPVRFRHLALPVERVPPGGPRTGVGRAASSGV
jgi:hypothetical protein